MGVRSLRKGGVTCVWNFDTTKVYGTKMIKNLRAQKQSHYRGVWEHTLQKILDFYIDFNAIW